MSTNDIEQSLNCWKNSTLEHNLYGRFRWYDDSIDKFYLDVNPVIDKGWIVYKYVSQDVRSKQYSHADMFIISQTDNVLRKSEHVLPLDEGVNLLETSEGQALGRLKFLDNVGLHVYGEELMLAGINIQVDSSVEDYFSYGYSFVENVGVPHFMPVNVSLGSATHVGVKTFQEVWIIGLIPEGCSDILISFINSMRQIRWKVEAGNTWSVMTMPRSSMMRLVPFRSFSFNDFLVKEKNFNNDEFSMLLWSEINHAAAQDDYSWSKHKHVEQVLRTVEDYLNKALA